MLLYCVEILAVLQTSGVLWDDCNLSFDVFFFLPNSSIYFLVGLTLYLHFFVTVRSTCTLRNHGIIIFLKRNKMNKTKQLLQISYVVHVYTWITLMI